MSQPDAADTGYTRRRNWLEYITQEYQSDEELLSDISKLGRTVVNETPVDREAARKYRQDTPEPVVILARAAIEAKGLPVPKDLQQVLFEEGMLPANYYELPEWFVRKWKFT